MAVHYTHQFFCYEWKKNWNAKLQEHVMKLKTLTLASAVLQTHRGQLAQRWLRSQLLALFSKSPHNTSNRTADVLGKLNVMTCLSWWVHVWQSCNFKDFQKQMRRLHVITDVLLQPPLHTYMPFYDDMGSFLHWVILECTSYPPQKRNDWNKSAKQ